MENTTINIHFFRNAQKGWIKYSELIEYFQNIPDFEISYDDKELNIVYTDNQFGFQYLYQITKVSCVKGIYKLDPAYLNINFMLCIPLLIPSFAMKEIFGLALKVSKTFDLQIFHESFDDVKLFSMADLISLFNKCQGKYLEENTPENKFFYDTNKLNEICKYQRSIETLQSHYSDISVNPCVPIVDKKINEFGICTLWNAGIATLFAPHFDFVNVSDEGGDKYYIRRVDFMKFMEKYLTKVDHFPDMYLLKPKAAKSSRTVISKLHKYAIVNQQFTELPLCDLIDRY